MLIAITTGFQTPWLDFGDPVLTKILKQGCLLQVVREQRLL